MKKTQAGTLLLAAFLALETGSAAALMQDRPVRPDPAITRDVQVALFSQLGAPVTTVFVDTNLGIVRLHGTLSSASLEERLLELTRRVAGVRGVESALQVVPLEAVSEEDESGEGGSGEALTASDEDLFARLAEALAVDGLLGESGLRVVSVEEGVVRLEGRARLATDEVRALRLCSEVAGVRNLESQVQVPELVDEDVWADLDRLGRTPEMPLRDTWLTSRIKVELWGDAQVACTSLGVEVRDGMAMLFGAVGSKAEIARAVGLARAVPGVKGVDQALIVAPALPVEASHEHEDLATSIRQALAAQALLVEGTAIEVSVEGDIVQLEGEVPSRLHALSALVAVRHVPGVAAVRDRLHALERGGA